MAKLRTLTFAIWLVIVAFATQPISSTRYVADLWDGKLFTNEEMSIFEIKGELRSLLNTAWWWKPIVAISSEGIRLDPSSLYYMDEMITGHFCIHEFLFDHDEYIRLVEKYPNVVKYINYLYDKALGQCEELVLTELEEFKNERPNQWKKLEKIYSAIESSDPIFADLRGDGLFPSQEETMNALEDFLKAKTSDPLDTYEDILSACQAIEYKWPVHNRMGVVSQKSPKVKKHGELTEYILYHRLCKMAKQVQAKFAKNFLLKQKN